MMRKRQLRGDSKLSFFARTRDAKHLESAYSKNGAKLSFTVTNEAGAVLRAGTDYTVKYQNNSAVTTAQTADNKKPLMTVTGKGNYAGKVEVSFTVVQASLADALNDGTVNVSCAQAQKKNGMKFQDFKLRKVESVCEGNTVSVLPKDFFLHFQRFLV